MRFPKTFGGWWRIVETSQWPEETLPLKARQVARLQQIVPELAARRAATAAS